MELSLAHLVHPARSGPEPHPGLLLLHGRGSDERDMHAMAAEMADSRLVVVSARAPLPFPWGGYMWYELNERGPRFTDLRTIQHSLNLLRRFLDDITSAYSIDPNRLYAGGFSMGAAMAGTLGLIVPERIAGVIMLSGYLPIDISLPFRPQAAAGHPFFLAHGTLDPVLPIQFGRLTRDYLSQTPVELTYHEYPIGHEVSGPELRDLARWIGDTLDVREPNTQPAE